MWISSGVAPRPPPRRMQRHRAGQEAGRARMPQEAARADHLARRGRRRAAARRGGVEAERPDSQDRVRHEGRRVLAAEKPVDQGPQRDRERVAREAREERVEHAGDDRKKLPVAMAIRSAKG